MPVFISLFLKFPQRIHAYFFSGCQFTFRPIFFLSHMKGAGILVLSLCGVHLWEKAPLYLAGKKYKKLCIFFPYHLLDSCNQTSFRGQKWLGHPHISLLQGFHPKFSKSIPAPFIWEPPGGFRPPSSSIKPLLGMPRALSFSFSLASLQHKEASNLWGSEV